MNLEILWKDGILVSHDVFSATEKAALETAWRDLRAGLDRPDFDKNSYYRDNLFIYGRLPGLIGELYKHPSLLSLAKEIMGEDIAIYMNRIMLKDKSFSAPVHMHQDMPYFHGSLNKLSVFVPLGSFNSDNGALSFVRGSSRLGLLPDRTTIDPSRYSEMDIITPELACGDVIFADILTWHSSHGSTSSEERPVLQIVYQPAHDGSYFQWSLPEPTLACGKWRTEHFSELKIADPNTPQNEQDSPSMPARTHTVWWKILAGSLAARAILFRKRALETGVTLPGLGQRVTLRRIIAGLWWRSKRIIAIPFQVFQRHASRLTSRRSRPLVSSQDRGQDAVDTNRALGPNDVRRVQACLTHHGAKSIVFCGLEEPGASGIDLDDWHGFDITGYLEVSYPGQRRRKRWGGRAVMSPEDVAEHPDLHVVVSDLKNFPNVMRLLQPAVTAERLILPADCRVVAPKEIRDMDSKTAMERSTALRYLVCSALRGHFIEFGTYWGRAFFPSFFELHHWLNGRFYAFDSFRGLSVPSEKETLFSAGDFAEGAYAFNERSFRALSEMLDIPKERLAIVPGYFSNTLIDKDPSVYGLGPRSVSVCRIDCDLFEPTRQALEFVTPLLESGALLYFDDWRLCRASPIEGERAAALQWLASHPEIELVEFDRDDWQHQWFIFQRLS